MKKEYQKPAMRIERIEHAQMLCGSITEVESGDTGIGYGGGGSGPARARQHGGIEWDDWDE